MSLKKISLLAVSVLLLTGTNIAMADNTSPLTINPATSIPGNTTLTLSGSLSYVDNTGTQQTTNLPGPGVQYYLSQINQVNSLLVNSVISDAMAANGWSQTPVVQYVLTDAQGVKTTCDISSIVDDLKDLPKTITLPNSTCTTG